MKPNTFIFLAGLHRSGTSLLHEILRSHPEISGFENTGVTEDEGQFLQTVYQPAKVFGGPGKFAFDESSHMDENSDLVSNENAEKLYSQWVRYLDINSRYLIEKSPPNIVRSRFLQALFPGSFFIVILRHPVAVSYATRKWSKTSIKSLVDHSLTAYEKFMEDLPYLGNVFILRYEEFVCSPLETMAEIYNFLGLDPVPVDSDIRKDVNNKYFNAWSIDREKFINRFFRRLPKSFEKRALRIGYSIDDVNKKISVPWLGAHKNRVFL